MTGDTTSSLTYDVKLSPGVLFHAQHSGNSGTGTFFYFDVTGGSGVTVALNGTTIGSLPGGTWTFNPPVSGAIVPGTGNFPGTYNWSVTCTNSTSGKVCNTPLEFTVSGGSIANPLGIGAPGGADFSPVTISRSSPTCRFREVAATAGTGLVGSGAGTSVTTPEPSTWAMMLIGFAGLAYAGFRKAKGARALSVA